MRLYLKLNSFHLSGTLIYRESDGQWMFWCLHCGRKPVPILHTLILLPLIDI
jgi:hypothetical protein